MFKLPQGMVNEIISKRSKIHTYLVAQCQGYIEAAGLINGKHIILSRDDYVQYYKNFTWDIELKSNPLDAFIPVPERIPIRINETDKKRTREFIVNRDELPDYERIAKRITMDELRSTLNPTHPVIMALDQNKVTLEDVVDDIYIYFCLFKYIDEITTCRLQMFSNMTPAIEYVVNNITINDIRTFLTRNKIDPDKVEKYDAGMFFEQDYNGVCKFYMSDESPCNIDVDNLINRLITNIVLKTDIYIILAIYLVLSFAISDFKRGIESECTKYVCEVLSVI